MKKLITAILTIVFILQLNAQNNEIFNDKVFLKNGSILYGQIVEYKIGGNLELKLSNGKTLTFSEEMVKKVEIYSPGEPNAKLKKNYDFTSNTIYNSIGFRIIPGGSRTFEVSESGIGIDYSLGYRYNEYLSIGIGTGIETYNYGFDEFFIPLYVDFISFLKKSYASPFLGLKAGYGFMITNDDRMIDSNGGVMLNPAVGIRFTGNSNLNYSLDINFKYQKADFVYKSWQWTSQISYRNLVLRRFSIRFGVLF